MKLERRIVKSSRTSRINLPLEFLKLLDIKINEVVNVELVNDVIVISKKVG